MVIPPALPGQEATPIPTAEIPQAPIAVIEAPAVGQTGTPVLFSAAQSTAASPIVQYAWTFGDGSVADAVAVEKTYGDAGAYFVNLKVVDSAGQEGLAQHQITINAALVAAPPDGDEAIEVPDSYIVVSVDGTPAPVGIVGGIPTFNAGVGQTVRLDASPALELIPTLQVAWKMGDGTAEIPGIVVEHQYTAADVYQIVISATDGQQTVTKLWQVNVSE